MPSEYETKPCSIRGCGGTMTYSERAVPPGPRVGSAAAFGERVRGGEPRPGWCSDTSIAHVEFVD